MRLLNKAIILTSRDRKLLAEEGRQLRERIEALGVPRMWGVAPPDIVRDAQEYQKKCCRAGLSQGAVFEDLGSDPEHTSATDVLLVIDEIIMALEPPPMIGG